MLFTKPISKLRKNDVALAGGKGASLGELASAGIPVPSGFVILAGAFEQFIKENKLAAEIDTALHKVRHEEMHTVEAASELIRGLIHNVNVSAALEKEIKTEFKKLKCRFVAVRSSATSEDSASAAWAGQLETYLNTTEKDLLANVKKCRASLFSPRAIFYRFEKGLHKDNISVAVVIQKMLESDASGIAFSVHPVTQDKNQLIIEAGFGLGEAIVSGEITPDSYVVEKDHLKIIESQVHEQKKMLVRNSTGGNKWVELGAKGKKQVLSEKEILELAKLIIKIEKHYDFPVDVEWAMEKGKFFITQSRPITTLSNESSAKKITLSKYMMRENSIFYAHVWNEADRDFFDQFVPETNVKSMLFQRNNQGVLEVWFDYAELDIVFDKIAKALSADAKLIDLLINRFYDGWKVLLPYFKGKDIQNLSELRRFYSAWVKWWAPMAYLFVIIDMENVSQEVRDKALRVRTDTQEYSEEGDKVLERFVRVKYKKYEELTGLLTPDEAFRLDSLSKNEIALIKKRKSGYALATFERQSALFDNAELENELARRKIELAQEKKPKGNELSGTTAQSGKVNGIARLVLRKADLGKVTEGDVLVTYATSPEYVPAMRKAAAIVTDEGGM